MVSIILPNLIIIFSIDKQGLSTNVSEEPQYRLVGKLRGTNYVLITDASFAPASLPLALIIEVGLLLCFFRLSYDAFFWVQKLTTNNSIIKVELPHQKVLNFTKLFFNVYLH